MSFQRKIQLFCLGTFLILLTCALTGSFTWLQQDFFLRLDPTIGIISSIAGWKLIAAFFPAIVVVALCLLVGRVFCGYICPMGTTLDGGDILFSVSYKKQKKLKQFRVVKYLIFFFLVGASLLGVSFVFSTSPISLITRFYGLLIEPVLAFFGSKALGLIKPAADQLELTSVLFANIRTPRFATQFFILVFFISLFALSKLTPRFWCRYLCPAGGILSLFSRKPVFRRQVSLDCDSCNRCVRACAMGAIDEDNPLITKHEECTVCLTCKKVCPSNSVTFGTGRQKIAHAPAKDRRRFLIASVTGAGTAAVCLTGLNAPSNTIVNGQISTEKLLRPPAALPENEFLSMCVRCGECMIACPTNTLQPLWFQAGLIGLFSPVITPRRSFCDPDCHRCAAVCPTNSIRVISKEERMWAKTGTAVILKHKCLAWEQQQKCMVCDETCPFNAVVFDKEPGNPVPVPKVLEEKCTGCGYCEYHCPVQNESAIIISPMGELRLEKGSYKKEGQLRGLKISTKKIESDYSSTPEVESGNQAPGFTE